MTVRHPYGTDEPQDQINSRTGFVSWQPDVKVTRMTLACSGPWLAQIPGLVYTNVLI